MGFLVSNNSEPLSNIDRKIACWKAIGFLTNWPDLIQKETGNQERISNWGHSWDYFIGIACLEWVTIPMLLDICAPGHSPPHCWPLLSAVESLAIWITWHLSLKNQKHLIGWALVIGVCANSWGWCLTGGSRRLGSGHVQVDFIYLSSKNDKKHLSPYLPVGSKKIHSSFTLAVLCIFLLHCSIYNSHVCFSPLDCELTEKRDWVVFLASSPRVPNKY